MSRVRRTIPCSEMRLWVLCYLQVYPRDLGGQLGGARSESEGQDLGAMVSKRSGTRGEARVIKARLTCCE